MGNKSVLIIFAVLLVFGLMVNPAISAAKVHKWKYQTPNAEVESGWWIMNKALKQMVEEGSNGQVQVELYTIGALVAMEETLGAVRNGVIEVGEYISAMAGDMVPAALVSELPYGGWNGTKHYNELYYKFGLAELLRKAYEKQFNVHYLAAPYFGYDSLITTFPVNKVEDLKGKAVWLAPHSNYLADFGAKHTEVPGFDMYMGLKLGTVQGLMWTWDGIETMKLKEVAKYAMLPSQVLPCTHTVVNQKAWEKLGSDLQKKLQDHIDANMQKAVEDMDKYCNEITVKLLMEGFQFIKPPEEELNKLRAAARKFWDQVAAMDEFSKKGVTIYKEMMKANNIPY